jgi:hypothetical protein
MNRTPRHRVAPGEQESTAQAAVCAREVFSSSRQTTFVHLVSGVTSSGKSTFLKESQAHYDSVLFPLERHLKDLKPGRHALHYNILRPIFFNFDSKWKKTIQQLRALLGAPARGANLFEGDQVLRQLARDEVSIHATVLVAPQRMILDRVASREAVEPLFSERAKAYDNKKWTRILAAVDLVDLYGQWLAFLESRNIPYQLIDSSDLRYSTIEGKTALSDLLSGALHR